MTILSNISQKYYMNMMELEKRIWDINIKLKVKRKKCTISYFLLNNDVCFEFFFSDKSLVWTVSGNVTSFVTLVTGLFLGFVWTFLGDVTELTTVVTFGFRFGTVSG